MRILIIYATYSGGTQKAAEAIGSALESHGFAVTLKNVMEAKPEDMNPYDLIILGSCTWERAADKKDGQLHIGFEDFIKKCDQMSFRDKRFAVFGLGDKEYLHFCRAADYLSEFVKQIQGTEVIPALKINSFFFDETSNIKHIHDWSEELKKAVSQ